MPHASCRDREEAIRRVAEYCPVHQTIVTLEGIKFVLSDRDHPIPAQEEEGREVINF
jgi:hypothetical protein